MAIGLRRFGRMTLPTKPHDQTQRYGYQRRGD
jgi:hypothetical protein